jgi:shikimate kinase
MQNLNNSSLKNKPTIFFLIGFMGSGKSHWGQVWAKELGIDFFDLDAEIEAKESKTVAQIFETNGEDYFRKIETEILKIVGNKPNCIIACGGGTPCFYNNINWMNEQGTTIYLKTTPQTILNRVLQEQEKRPLIKKMNQAELLFFIEQKLNEREAFYNQAKITLQTENLTSTSLTEFYA